mmetsp:Transcript_32323/g.70844  ORF Transcript_32323/g.70844 Transcript_32323/m.70844 type:complete len:226 (-) Transcript_32323:258-935(-)
MAVRSVRCSASVLDRQSLDGSRTARQSLRKVRRRCPSKPRVVRRRPRKVLLVMRHLRREAWLRAKLRHLRKVLLRHLPRVPLRVLRVPRLHLLLLPSAGGRLLRARLGRAAAACTPAAGRLGRRLRKCATVGAVRALQRLLAATPPAARRGSRLERLRPMALGSELLRNVVLLLQIELVLLVVAAEPRQVRRRLPRHRHAQVRRLPRGRALRCRTRRLAWRVVRL